ncbi:MAG TPA: hypothetical protein VNH46_12625, partial [Gemmatimonadales bacterium]|nr:hypothetical protein [Gemmatimonadales bacterium]
MPSTRLVELTLAGLLALGPAGLAAQDTTATRLATVSYVAGTSVYVSAGRADGLIEGQQLSLIRHDSVAAVLKVMFLSSRQASTEIVSGATDIAVGEQVRFRPRASTAPAAGAAAAAV